MTCFDAPAPLLPEIFQLHGKWRAHHEALVCEDRRLNWREFSEEINRFASGLLAAGILPRQRVAVLMSNDIEMAISLFGIMAAGCVSVPINLSVPDEGLVAMLNDADVVGIVATPDQVKRVENMSEHSNLPDFHLKLTVGDGPVDWQQWSGFLQLGETIAQLPKIVDDDELNIIYSSGTTGMPKGIVHTHRGRRDWAYDLALALRYHSGARTLLTIGLYSNISWVAMLCTLLTGGTLVIQRKFSPAAFVANVAAEHITHTAMVPIQFQQVMDEVDKQGCAEKLGSLQALMSCGSPLHSSLKRRIFETCACGIIELYGLTEGIITTLDPEDAEHHLSSVGKPLLGTDIKIIDDQDKEVGPGESGEVVARGRITMPGYLNRPDANEKAAWRDGHGNLWLRSGDIGQIDETGFLYIVDRKKDMILSGGQNIYPQDIEAVLYEHEQVRDVAVIAARSERWGETPIALVVPGETPCLEAELADWCNTRVGRQQRIAEVIYVTELPRNPNGKILKRELRKTWGTRIYHAEADMQRPGAPG